MAGPFDVQDDFKVWPCFPTHLHPFFLQNNIPLCVCTTFFFFLICSSVDGHAGCSDFGAFTNNAAVTTHVDDFVWTFSFLFLLGRWIPRGGIAESYGSSVQPFEELLSSRAATPSDTPTGGV